MENTADKLYDKKSYISKISQVIYQSPDINDTNTLLTTPSPLTIQVSRYGYICTQYDTFIEKFSKYISIPLEQNEIWQQHIDGTPCKWWQPIGVIYDIMMSYRSIAYDKEITIPIPMSLYLHTTNRPCNLLPYIGIESLCTQYLYTLKQSTYILYGTAQYVLQLGVTITKELLQSVCTVDIKWENYYNCIKQISNTAVNKSIQVSNNNNNNTVRCSLPINKDFINELNCAINIPLRIFYINFDDSTVINRKYIELITTINTVGSGITTYPYTYTQWKNYIENFQTNCKSCKNCFSPTFREVSCMRFFYGDPLKVHTVSSLISEILPNSTLIDPYEISKETVPCVDTVYITVDGIHVPLNTPITWLYWNMKQVDGFLYIILRKV